MVLYLSDNVKKIGYLRGKIPTWNPKILLEEFKIATDKHKTQHTQRTNAVPLLHTTPSSNQVKRNPLFPALTLDPVTSLN